MSIFVLLKLYCNRLVGIVAIEGTLVCEMLMLNEGGIFVSVVFCVGVYECAVTVVNSGVKGDWNVTCGRILLVGTSILLVEGPGC